MNQKLKNGLKTTFNVAALIVGGAGILLGAAVGYDSFFTQQACMDICIIPQQVMQVGSVVTLGLSGLLFWVGLHGVKNSGKPQPPAQPPAAPSAPAP